MDGRERKTCRGGRRGRGSENRVGKGFAQMHTVICPLGRICFIPRHVEDSAFDGDEDGFGGVAS